LKRRKKEVWSMTMMKFPGLGAEQGGAVSHAPFGSGTTATAPSLIVLDDDQAVAATISAMARTLGCKARFVCSSEAFFAEIEREPADVVIVDLLMPGQDGLEVMRELGARHSVQTVLSSGCDTRVLETARHSARSYGLDVIGVLPKPVRRSALMAVLQSALPRNCRPCGESTRTGLPAITAEMLRQALAEGQIRAHFQPKLRLSDHKPSGFEALARWQHPELGLIQPMEFIPLASGAGLDGELTKVMLDRSLAFLAELDKPELSVAVNVPMRICADPTFLNVLNGLLLRYGLSPPHLVLEVTEAGPMDMNRAEIDALTRLRINGFSLSIDDFGTGVSSLERLVRIPFDELKIDRFFARDIATSPSAKGVVRSLVQLAKTLGMTVTIEGIEDSEAMQLSRDLGCDSVQGYHVAKPMPPAQAREWLHEQASRTWLAQPAPQEPAA